MTCCRNLAAPTDDDKSIKPAKITKPADSTRVRFPIEPRDEIEARSRPAEISRFAKFAMAKILVALYAIET